MALPSSGQISFDDVRTEMSQSAKTSYAFTEWAAGGYLNGIGNNYYTPINTNSTSKPFSESSPLQVYSGISMSQWYSYDSLANVSLNTTVSLYPHCSDYCYVSSMVVIDAGTSNTSLDLYISGSAIYPYAGAWYIYYGKPWENDGGGTGSAIIITSGSTALDVDLTYTYNYTYDSNVGQYLYFVLYQDNCFSP